MHTEILQTDRRGDHNRMTTNGRRKRPNLITMIIVLLVARNCLGVSGVRYRNVPESSSVSDFIVRRSMIDVRDISPSRLLCNAVPAASYRSRWVGTHVIVIIVGAYSPTAGSGEQFGGGGGERVEVNERSRYAIRSARRLE